MSKNFNCPACGAPLVYDPEGDTLFQNCDSCNVPIVVPSKIIQASRDSEIEAAINMPPPEEIPTEEMLEIKGLAARGETEGAVKLHRESFGSDQAAAEKAVKHITSESTPEANAKEFQIEKILTPAFATAEPLPDRRLDPVRHQLRAGNKINAIKIFREVFRTGLKEAKEAVDAMEHGESINIADYTGR